MTRAYWPPDENTVLAEDLEARMRGQKKPSRCPLCRSIARFETSRHPYGEGYVEEFHHIECPVCGIVIDCRDCFKYLLHEPKNHPCPDLLSKSEMCTCTPNERNLCLLPSPPPSTSPTS